MLVQGAEGKLRPIDDCLEAQLNFAYTSTSYLKLQDVDYVSGLALRIASSVVEGKQKSGLGVGLESALILAKHTNRWGSCRPTDICRSSSFMMLQGNLVSMSLTH